MRDKWVWDYTDQETTSSAVEARMSGIMDTLLRRATSMRTDWRWGWPRRLLLHDSIYMRKGIRYPAGCAVMCPPKPPSLRLLLTGSRVVAFCLLPVLVWARPADAAPLRLRAVEASGAAVEGYPLSAAVDGLMTPDNSWSPAASSREITAVFSPDQPCGATLFLFELGFLSNVPGAHFRSMELNVTSDPQPNAKGRWMPLIPELPHPEGETLTTSGTVVTLKPGSGSRRVVLLTRVPFTGVTGFRLRFFPGSSAPDGKSSLSPAADGVIRLTELRIEAHEPITSNIALGRQVYCSRAVSPGSPSRNLTDGFSGTWSQPGAGEGPAFFEMDLGRDLPLDHLVLRYPDQTAGAAAPGEYGIEILPEAGSVANSQPWQGRVLAPGAGQAGLVRAGDGTGSFQGRRIRIHSRGAEGPWLAEIEVYPALAPRITSWMADSTTLSEMGGALQIPASTHRLSFLALPGEGLLASAMRYRWKIPGWRDAWQLVPLDGRAVLDPPPPPGSWKMVLEAQHSDGLWSGPAAAYPLIMPEPWWKAAPNLALAGAGVILTGLTGWWLMAHLALRRRIASAQQRLALDQERIRMARDMHDDMGARLSCIALLAERTRHTSPDTTGGMLENLADNARAAVAALDSMVWTVDPGNDTAGHLADYLSDYTPAYLDAAGVGCFMELQVEHPQAPLAMAVRHSLLMAAKEALHNAVSHSGSADVRLRLSDAGGQFTITVSDEGRGFTGEPKATQNGLRNMQARLLECGGTCTVTSTPSGTIVTLSVPHTIPP